MSSESQYIDYKSLRVMAGGRPAWDDLARDCVAFANAQGGHIRVGIEDGQSQPPANQHIAPDLVEKIHRRIGELTVNVTVSVQLQHVPSCNAEYLEIRISRSASPASTTDGRYYIRVGDTCKPLVGEEVQRLLNERSAQPWETQTILKVKKNDTDMAKRQAFVAGIRASDRVKDSVKEKSDDELLDHYYLSIGGYLTNLGILCVGRREGRAQLGTAPVIQYIKYDDDERKVNKIAWDDHSHTPMELIDAVWRDIPDFRESYELPDGLFRQHVPIYDQRVIRELLVNALVHRPYTQRGDIYLNMYPDRLEVVNPGLLPLGVTPDNILHQSVRRNNELARVFHDLGLMEREGSGYDLLYEVLLSQSRPVPELKEGADRVEVTVRRRIMNPQAIELMAKVDQTFELRQREKITLGLLAQHEAMTARQLADTLELSHTEGVVSWLGRLPEWGIIRQSGRTKGTRYYVDPNVLRKLEFPSQTTLTRIEPHRLRELVREDIQRYPSSSIGEIHERIGSEINRRQVKTALDELCSEGLIQPKGEKRWRKYWPAT